MSRGSDSAAGEGWPGTASRCPPAGISLEQTLWVPKERLARKVEPTVRLFCLPYAGGGASIYRNWQGLLPPEVEVRPIQLPGRENRIDEPALRHIDDAAPLLADVLADLLDLPFVLFGHSMGALVAYRLALELSNRGRPAPRLLIASGRRAPHMPAKGPEIHHLPDPEFIDHLRDLGGTPAEVFKHRELVDLLMPMLRADFMLNASAEAAAMPARLRCPVVALGAVDDREVPERALAAWQDATSQSFSMQLFEGGHFYITSKRAELLAAISSLLAPIARSENDMGLGRLS